MKRFIPSPAVGIAFAALFVALTGSSFAAPAREAASKLISGSKIKKNSITSAQIKNGSLASADFRKGQLPRGAKGDAGPAGPRGATGAPGTPGAPGQPGQGAPVAWARVSLDGTLAKGSGVVATRMANGGTSPGQFEVDFDRNVAGCAWIAGHVGDISTPAPGGIDVDGPANTQVPQNRVSVNTRTSQGTLAFQNFAVAVYC